MVEVRASDNEDWSPLNFDRDPVVAAKRAEFLGRPQKRDAIKWETRVAPYVRDESTE